MYDESVDVHDVHRVEQRRPTAANVSVNPRCMPGGYADCINGVTADGKWERSCNHGPGPGASHTTVISAHVHPCCRGRPPAPAYTSARDQRDDATAGVRLQIRPGDADFEVLYRRRNDAEGINRHLDDTLWLRRAHSVGHRRQLLNLITYALGVNALSMHVHRKSSLHPSPPDPITAGAGEPARLERDEGRRSGRIDRNLAGFGLYDGDPQTAKTIPGFSQVFIRSLASSSTVEQRAFNPLVQGSKPWGRTGST